MSELRKLLNLISENSCAGSVASVAMPLGATQKRVKESEEDTTEADKGFKNSPKAQAVEAASDYGSPKAPATEPSAKDDQGTPSAPPVIEYGNWENSALVTTGKVKAKRKGEAPKDSVYGKKKVSESRKSPADAKDFDDFNDDDWEDWDKKVINVRAKARAQDAHKRKDEKNGTAEGSLNEDKGFDVVKSLVSAFNDNVSGDANIPLAAERPGSRVWTRSDGTRYRDHGNIQFYQGYIDPQDVAKWKATNPVEKFSDWLTSQPGVKPIGQVSGEFRSDAMRDAVAYKGLYFVLTPHGSVIWGSVSRFKNPNSVWRQQGPEQGVAEDSSDNHSPMVKDTIHQDKIKSLKNLIAIAREQGRQLRVQELELELKKLQNVTESQLDEAELSEEQLKAKQRREELFNRAADRDLGKRAADRAVQKKKVNEGASDYVADVIEYLRSDKPGLDRETFLDELYHYIDSKYGKKVADMTMDHGDDSTYDEWYDSYSDMTESSLREDASPEAISNLEHGLMKWAEILEAQLMEEAAESNEQSLIDFDGDEEAYSNAVEQLRDKYQGTVVAVLCNAILNSLDHDMFESKVMGKRQSLAYQLDGGANDEDHEGDRRREQEKHIQDYETLYYIRFKDSGKVYKQKDQPKTFNGKKAANAYALKMIANNPELKGNILLTQRNEDDTPQV